MSAFPTPPLVPGSAAGFADGSGRAASMPRTSAELARAYVESEVAFETMDELQTTAIAVLVTLCPSMLLIASTPGEVRSVDLGECSGHLG